MKMGKQPGTAIIMKMLKKRGVATRVAKVGGRAINARKHSSGNAVKWGGMK